MNNKVFIVCPFSMVEHAIREKFGNDVYFLSAPAGYFRTQSLEHLSSIRQCIDAIQPQTIYIVNDTSCQFLHAIVQGNANNLVPTCQPLSQLYNKYLTPTNREVSVRNKVRKLAELSIYQQVINFIQPNMLGEQIMQYNIQIKGLIVNKELNEHIEIEVGNLLD